MYELAAKLCNMKDILLVLTLKKIDCLKLGFAFQKLWLCLNVTKETLKSVVKITSIPQTTVCSLITSLGFLTHPYIVIG